MPVTQKPLTLVFFGVLAATLALPGATPLSAEEQPASSSEAGWWPAPQGAAAGLPKADESADKEDSQGWLMRSRVVDVGWPEIKMPKLRWKSDDEAATSEESETAFARMAQATRGAANRGRAAWNGAIDKIKIGPLRSKESSGEPGFFAKMFGEEVKPQRVDPVAEFVGQDRPKLR